jgi:hypothetical protein
VPLREAGSGECASSTLFSFSPAGLPLLNFL